MSELGNLGIDCLIGGDPIDHIGGVTVRRCSDSQYSVIWESRVQLGAVTFLDRKLPAQAWPVEL